MLGQKGYKGLADLLQSTADTFQSSAVSVVLGANLPQKRFEIISGRTM